MRSTSARPRRSPAERALEIALAAESLALDDGLSAITLRAVGQNVGVAASLVAHYEPSMDALVAKSFRAVADREIDDVSRLVGAQQDPLRELRALLDAVSDPGRDDVAALWTDAWSIGRRNADLAAAARDCMDRWQALITGIVSRGLARGTFRTDDPEGVGVLVFALVDATNAYALVGYRQPAERDDLIRRTVAGALSVSPERLGPSMPTSDPEHSV